MISKHIYSVVILHQIITYMNITYMNIFNEYQYLSCPLVDTYVNKGVSYDGNTQFYNHILRIHMFTVELHN